MYDELAMIGDKVYISGLYGSDFKLINNKVGVLKKIFSITSNNSVNQLGEITMGGHSFPINLKYVYKLKNSNISPILLSDDMLDDLFFEHNIRDAVVGIDDENHHQIALCNTNENKGMLLVISTLN